MTTSSPVVPLETPRAALMRTPQVDSGDAVSVYASAGNFDTAQRMAKSLASSTLVPEAYRGNLPNCLIAIELASRIGCSVLMAMQSLHVIQGRPSWAASFLIATVNQSGKFTPLRPRWEGTPGTDGWGCRAVAHDAKTGEECPGTLVNMALVKAEGWYGRNGSKWKTMPEQMLVYRACAFWCRVYAPELSLGMQTSEEVLDTVGHTVRDIGGTALPDALTPGDSAALEERLRAQAVAEPAPAAQAAADAAPPPAQAPPAQPEPEAVQGAPSGGQLGLTANPLASESAARPTADYLPPAKRGDQYEGPEEPPPGWKPKRA